jgi:prepilin-type N-terminal cleavage/methylation domain-containing protein
MLGCKKPGTLCVPLVLSTWSKTAFTLTELVVATATVGILAVIVYPSYQLT